MQTMAIEFLGKAHRDRFFDYLTKDQTKPGDVERYQLFYTMACPYLCEYMQGVYDFQLHQLANGYQEYVENLEKRPQLMIKRALHLYNSFNDDIPTYNLFYGLDDSNKTVIINALALYGGFTEIL